MSDSESSSNDFKSLLAKGAIGAVALAGTTAIPMVVQQTLQPPSTPTASPTVTVPAQVSPAPVASPAQVTPAQIPPTQTAPVSSSPQATPTGDTPPTVRQLLEREKPTVLPEAAPGNGKPPVIEQLIEGDSLATKGKSKRKLPKREQDGD